jgi:hypothetical protein
VLAGLAAGALWGLVFVSPRMVGGFSSVDLTAGRFVAYGAVAVLVLLLRARSRPWPTASQALSAAGSACSASPATTCCWCWPSAMPAPRCPPAHRHHPDLGDAARQAGRGCAGARWCPGLLLTARAWR